MIRGFFHFFFLTVVLFGCTEQQRTSVVVPKIPTPPISSRPVVSACGVTFARTFDGVVARLEAAAATPEKLSGEERYCLVGIAGQALGIYPLERSALSASLNGQVGAVLRQYSSSSDPLNDAGTYAGLIRALRSTCSDEILTKNVRELTAADAAHCGVIRLPGTPRRLGEFVAQFESGSREGGYDLVAADPEAGGWTYGKYQLASEAGGIKSFLDAVLCRNGSSCLHEDYRPIGRALEAAGGVLAAQNAEPAFVDLWAQLSREDRRMQQAQESYHALIVWQPASNLLATLGISPAQTSCGLREAALSIQTQHSPGSARRIFYQAADAVGVADQKMLIVEANRYRLQLLGEPGGFYASYGQTCRGPDTATGKAYACSYLKGVRSRWEKEAVLFSGPAFANTTCP